MDTPVVTKEKAMAKLLAHKCLKPKFQKIIDKFASVPTFRLLEIDPRKMRRKQRKEKIRLTEKKAAKAKADAENNLDSKKIIEDSTDKPEEKATDKLPKEKGALTKTKANGIGVKKVPKKDVEITKKKPVEKEIIDEADSDDQSDERSDDDLLNIEAEDTGSDGESMGSYGEREGSDDEVEDEAEEEDEDDQITFCPPTYDPSEDSDVDESDEETKSVAPKSPEKKTIINVEKLPDKILPVASSVVGDPAKPKRKGKRMMVDLPDSEIDFVNTEKTVDSFFVTDSGDNYMTVALPRPPDIKPGTFVDENAANRRSRRAVMFGKEAPRPRKSFQNPKQNLYSSNKPDQMYDKRKYDNNTPSKNFENNDRRENKFNNRKFNNADSPFGAPAKVEEKLHPSWEAKKKKVAIVAFKGNKITFD